MPNVPNDSYIAPPSNIVGSPNRVGTVIITDSAGRVVHIQKIALSDPTSDVQAAVDSMGGLQVYIAQDAMGASEGTLIRRLLEQIHEQLKQLNEALLSVQ